jgi:hypothetical protein
MMSKSTITRLFIGSLLAIAGGLVLGFIAVLRGYTSGAFVMNGPDVVGVQSTAMAWTVAALVVIGILAIIGGVIGQFVAWIGAVLETAQLEDKTWFLALLLLGVLSFGFLAMLAYVIAGPDGATAPAKQRPVPIAAVPAARA